MRGRAHLSLAVLLCLGLAACAGAGPSPPVAGVRAERHWVKTELYFGLTRPGGGEVTPDEWARFVDEHLAPRFKDGFTVIAARGRYLGRDGVVAEPARVVVLIQSGAEEGQRAVEEIREIYKRLFQQESVLRVTTPVDAAF